MLYSFMLVANPSVPYQCATTKSRVNLSRQVILNPIQTVGDREGAESTQTIFRPQGPVLKKEELHVF